MNKIAYEPHPVSPERKQELRAQGFTIIDAVFRPAEHEDPAGGASAGREALDAAINTLPGGNTDPDYVVRAMRSHFGDVFTDDDESRVRELVRPRKPSDGLKVEEIKAALAEKGVAIPDGVTLKADLAALLDAA